MLRFRGPMLLGVALGTLAAAPALPGGDPPTNAGLRSAFEAQFPKSEANAAALELERLTASIGIDLAPDPTKLEGDGIAPAGKREHPPADLVARYVTPNDYLETELTKADERIGPPPAALQKFFSEHEAAIREIRSILLREEPRWEVDVSRGDGGPGPNIAGIVRLTRLLTTRALLDAREGDPEEAIRTLEAAWRLSDALTSRPEWVAHLVVVGIMRQPIGVLRKVDSPAYGWADRLRSGNLVAGFLGAFANGVWMMSPQLRDLTGEAGAYGRAVRRVVEGFQEGDLCAWTSATLEKLWDEAFRAETDGWTVRAASMPNIIGTFFRLRRLLVDAELTALVLDARAERAALRRPAWPDKLRSAGCGVCPYERWSYSKSDNGTATVAFEGKLQEPDTPVTPLPLAFTAGKPTPARPSLASPGSGNPLRAETAGGKAPGSD